MMHEASLAVAVWLQGSLNEGKCGVRRGVWGGGAGEESARSVKCAEAE